MVNYELNFGNVQLIAPLLKLAYIVDCENNDSQMLKLMYKEEDEELIELPEHEALANIENNLNVLADEWNRFFDKSISGYDKCFDYGTDTPTPTDKPTGFYHDNSHKSLTNIAWYIKDRYGIPEKQI